MSAQITGLVSHPSAIIPTDTTRLLRSAMPILGTRVLLVVTAFAPLWLGLGILETFGSGRAALAFYALAAASPPVLALYLRKGRRIEPREVKVTTARRRDDAVLAYVATYIVPFALGTAVSGWRERVVIAMFIVLVLGLHVHARTYYIHPLLALARFHVWDIELTTGRSTVLIARRVHIPAGSSVRARVLDADVYLEAPGSRE